jgi:hypothetical protein
MNNPICTRCKQPFEYRNGDYVVHCDQCDHDIALIDEAVRRVLKGVLGVKSMSFSEFRFGMLNECELVLSDQEVHDLFHRHVAVPTKGDYDVFDEKAVDQAIAWTTRQEQEREAAAQQAKERRAQQSKNQTQRRGKKKRRGKKGWRDVTLGEAAESATSKARAVGKMLRATRHP